MPGGYAHIYLANRMTDYGAKLPELLSKAFEKYLEFCELGSVSPDLPYLALGNPDQQSWADTFHYEGTFDFVTRAAKILCDLEGLTQLRCLAWLMGYVSHLVMDGTIHPVVEKIVGNYADHKNEHRTCELNQDAYIFPDLGYGTVDRAEPIKTGPKLCADPDNPSQLNPELLSFWAATLQDTHPYQYNQAKPNINLWFKNYIDIMDKVVEEGGQMYPFTRHVLVDILAISTPDPLDVDDAYIYDLNTPIGIKSYHDLIDSSMDNVLATWDALARAVIDSQFEALALIPNYNLDTGRAYSDKYVWW